MGLRKFRLNVEELEDRLVPSGTELDLITAGATQTVNGAIFRQVNPQPTGTGVINSFVRLQTSNGKATMQQGFNTDARPLQFDENTSPQFTRSLKLSDVPEVDIGGQKFREFLLDINQKASQPFLSLDELRLFVGGSGNLTGYSGGSLHGLNAVYDLDGGNVDSWLKLDARLTHGSGSGDMLFYVPSSVFSGASGNYVYLYSKFGVNVAGNSGFEEWAVSSSSTSSLTNTSGSIHGTVTDASGQALKDVTIFLDFNHNGVFDMNEVYTTTDVNGNYHFDNLAVDMGGLTTYTVSQLSDDTSPNKSIVVSLNNGLNDAININFIDTSTGGGSSSSTSTTGSDGGAVGDGGSPGQS